MPGGDWIIWSIGGFVLTLQEDLIVGDFGDRDSSDLELFGLRRTKGRECVRMVSLV